MLLMMALTMLFGYATKAVTSATLLNTHGMV